jgi:hypothetical protein
LKTKTRKLVLKEKRKAVGYGSTPEFLSSLSHGHNTLAEATTETSTSGTTTQEESAYA